MPDGKERTAAVDIVRRYLRLVETRDLDQAAMMLARDATITFPGGRIFTSLSDQVASSAGRFRSVTKSFDQFDEMSEGDTTIVYALGRLSGEALDGTAFDSVRFIDRFELRRGRITDHMVWNDLAECGIVRPERSDTQRPRFRANRSAQ